MAEAVPSVLAAGGAIPIVLIDVAVELSLAEQVRLLAGETLGLYKHQSKLEAKL